MKTGFVRPAQALNLRSRVGLRIFRLLFFEPQRSSRNLSPDLLVDYAEERYCNPMESYPLKRIAIALAALVLLGASLACAGEVKAPEASLVSPPDPTSETFDWNHTTYGFFPSPPEANLEKILGHFETLGEHADFILVQPNIPWKDFTDGVEGESQSRTDLRNQIILARRNGLRWIFVIDPLNGLNRREFFGLPDGWDPSFANPDIRAAFTNFTSWVVKEFEPHYLGLASEINTYLDAHPDDGEQYMSLYFEVYDQIKIEAPDTQVFVTFQWDDLNNMFPPAAEGRPAYQTNWEQIEAFEPKLDLWVISSYPYFVFEEGAIPADYYTPLSQRTDKPLAVAEGGWTTARTGPIKGSEAGQIAYLESIHEQLGERLSFWVYLILADLNMDSIRAGMEELGRPKEDIETLSLFARLGLMTSEGEPKPALSLWDQYRGSTP